MATIDELQVRHVHPVGERVIEGHGHVPARPGLAASDQRLENALEGGHAGGNVAYGHTDAGHARFIAGDAGQTRLSLDQEVVGLEVAIRSLVAVTGDRAGDQRRAAAAQLVRRETETVDGPGREVLDEHVGALDHAAEEHPVVVAPKIERDRFLAAVEPDEIGALAVDVGVVAAGEVALRALDLDHPCAGIGKAGGAIGRRHRLFQGDDEKSFEIGVHGRSMAPEA
jgi:hypothetical protein